MAIQFTDFSRAPILDNPANSLFEDILKGYKMSQEPGKMNQEASARDLANQLKKLDLEHKPKEFALNDQHKSLTNSMLEKANNHKNREYSLSDAFKESMIEKNKRVGITGGAKVNGMVANFVATHPDATQDQVRDFADRVLESQMKHTEAGTGRSNKLNETQEARSQTNQGKLLQEAKEVDEGYVPGTGRTQKFGNPDIQKFYKNQYDLKLQKERSDSVTRNRTIYAGLVDNTFDNINVDNLVQYSGIEGEIEKRLSQGQLVSDEEQGKYLQYKEEVAKVGVLAKQIRQFYGDSISPSNLQKLENISNPAKWSESPAAAKAQFEAFKKIVKQETGIYRKSLSSISPFEEGNSASSPESGKGKVFNLGTGGFE